MNKKNVGQASSLASPSSTSLAHLTVETLVALIRKSTEENEVRNYDLALEALIAINGSPILRADDAYFFVEAPNATSVAIMGDWSNWKPMDKLVRLHEHSRFYYCKKKFPIDARLAYRILLDGQEAVLDPLNLYTEQEVFGTNSVLRMPAYREELLAIEPRKGLPRGRLQEIEVPAGKGIASRKVTVYSSMRGKANTRNNDLHPILYVHDGLETIAIGKFVNILDNLYYQEPHLPRCTVVFVPPVNRDTEYMLDEGFAKYFAKTLVPFVESKLKIKPAYRGTSGSSLGGLLSAQLGFLYPEMFSRIAMQSPAVWVQKELIVREYGTILKLPLRFFLHTGTINDGQEGARKFLRVLQVKGYPTQYRETNESHNWGTWRGSYADIVRWFVSLP